MRGGAFSLIGRPLSTRPLRPDSIRDRHRHRQPGPEAPLSTGDEPHPSDLTTPGTSAPGTPWSDRLEALHALASARFGARCLWSAAPSKTLDGMRTMAALLRAHGDMAAWKVAAEIRREIGRAALPESPI